MFRYIFIFVALVTLPQTTVGQSVPNFCTYIEDKVYTCDYASMVSASDRPIEFTDFGTEPQQLDVTVNGFLPFFGKWTVTELT